MQNQIVLALMQLGGIGRKTILRKIPVRAGMEGTPEALSSLLEETRALLDAGVFERSPTAAAAIGYKELLPYLRGECTLADAVTELKTATRRYAKRQLTWFGAKNYVRPLTVDGESGMLKSEQIVNNACACAEGAWNML